MSRFTKLSKAVRKPALASATAGVCVALAVTGVELAGGHTAAPAASAAATPSAVSSPATSIAAAPAGFTTAAVSRQVIVKRHSPRGTSHAYRAAGRATFYGRAWDRDSSAVWVVLYRNGHRVDAAKTTTRSHERYRMHANLKFGMNHFTVVVRNVGMGKSTVLRTANMRVRKTWTAHYYGAKRIAAQMFGHYGWGEGQMQSLINLWNRESGWSTHAANPSGAYGIPQALPGSKMSGAGPNWQSNAETQIRWGLGYIASRYGSPNGAWAHSQASGWY